MSEGTKQVDVLIYKPGSMYPIAWTITLPKEHHYPDLNATIGALIGPNKIEHVAVLYNGERHDLFVDEFSAINPRVAFDDPKLPDEGPQPVNEAATLIYHEASRQRGDDLTDAPKIHGVAVLCLQKVWR